MNVTWKNSVAIFTWLERLVGILQPRNKSQGSAWKFSAENLSGCIPLLIKDNKDNEMRLDMAVKGRAAMWALDALLGRALTHDMFMTLYHLADCEPSRENEGHHRDHARYRRLT